jgi:hypothetical protein
VQLEPYAVAEPWVKYAPKPALCMTARAAAIDIFGSYTRLHHFECHLFAPQRANYERRRPRHSAFWPPRCALCRTRSPHTLRRSPSEPFARHQAPVGGAPWGRALRSPEATMNSWLFHPPSAHSCATKLQKRRKLHLCIAWPEGVEGFLQRRRGKSSGLSDARHFNSSLHRRSDG